MMVLLSAEMGGHSGSVCTLCTVSTPTSVSPWLHGYCLSPGKLQHNHICLSLSYPAQQWFALLKHTDMLPPIKQTEWFDSECICCGPFFLFFSLSLTFSTVKCLHVGMLIKQWQERQHKDEGQRERRMLSPVAAWSLCLYASVFVCLTLCG